MKAVKKRAHFRRMGELRVPKDLVDDDYIFDQTFHKSGILKITKAGWYDVVLKGGDAWTAAQEGGV
ncbi:MAG: hypothetical protein ACXIUV_07095 [Alkalilacustris sp.]